MFTEAPMVKPADDLVPSEDAALAPEPAPIPAEPVPATAVLGPFDDVPADYIRVTFAHHWTTDDGVDVLPGEQAVIPVSTARSLLGAGYLAINPGNPDSVAAAFGHYRP
jgi:hypothetical protein